MSQEPTISDLVELTRRATDAANQRDFDAPVSLDGLIARITICRDVDEAGAGAEPLADWRG
jgi:hypothetical protein